MPRAFKPRPPAHLIQAKSSVSFTASPWSAGREFPVELRGKIGRDVKHCADQVPTRRRDFALRSGAPRSYTALREGAKDLRRLQKCLLSLLSASMLWRRKGNGLTPKIECTDQSHRQRPNWQVGFVFLGDSYWPRLA